MDCRTAQELIVPFIEGTLDDERCEQFIKHIETCPDCYDELEVYYIVIIGVKQLDDEEHLLVDFNGGLQDYITAKKKQLERRQLHHKHVRFAATAACLGLLLAGFLLSAYIYDHPDTTARYVRTISDVFGLDLDLPEGKTVSFIIRDTQDYFTGSTLDLPLRLIDSSAEDENSAADDTQTLQDEDTQEDTQN